MSLTFKELCDRLKQLDEITLLEVLDLNSEQLVDVFEDFIRDRIEDVEDDLVGMMDDGYEEEDETN